MKVVICGLLTIGGLLISGASCGDSYDYEVFKGSTQGRSESISPEQVDSFGDDYYSESKSRLNKRFAEYSIFDFGQIDEDPAFTKSEYYISPDSVEDRFKRSPAKPEEEESDQYSDSYSDFLAKYFGQSAEKEAYRQDNKKKNKDDDAESVDEEDGAYGSEYERIKQLSQDQEKEIKQNPKHCKHEVKGEMTCNICHNPETGANSKSCSYTAAPEPKKYAYVKERNFNSKDNEDADEEAGAAQAVSEEGGDSQQNTAAENQEEGKAEEEEADNKEESKKSENYSVEPESESVDEEDTNTQKSEPKKFRSSYRAADTESAKDDQSEAEDDTANRKPKTFDSYYQKQQQRQQAIKESPQYEFVPEYPSNSKKDVETVLAEFKKKDWSACTKVKKGELTCYYCKDENGVKHEECMFVSETKHHKRPAKLLKRSESLKRAADIDEIPVPTTTTTTTTSRPIRRRQVVRGGSGALGRKPTTAVPSTTATAPTNGGGYQRPRNLASLRPEDSPDQNGGAKQTFKRTVSYVVENNDESGPKMMVYKSQITHGL